MSFVHYSCCDGVLGFAHAVGCEDAELAEAEEIARASESEAHWSQFDQDLRGDFDSPHSYRVGG